MRDPDVEEKMLRDADIAHVIGYRQHMIAGRDWTLTPRDEAHAGGELAVEVGSELIEAIDHFADARLNLSIAFFSGSRFARIHLEPRELPLGDGKLRTWLVPSRLEDMDKRNYRIVPKLEDEKITAHWERWDIGKNDYVPETLNDAMRTIRHVYADNQSTLGHGRALREPLGWWWYAKQHIFQESLQAVERFAQGIICAKVDGARDADGKPNQEVIDDWVKVLQNMRSRHVLVFDKGDDVQMIQASGTGWEMAGKIRDEIRSTIFTLVLGANLTTSADKGGSFALAEVQENSTETLVQYDRRTLEETMTRDLLGCLWHCNYPNLLELGIADQKPRFSIDQEKRQDPKERAEVAAVLHGMGVDLSDEDIYEQTGFRKPEKDESFLAGAAAMDMFGGGGFGGGAPNFGPGLGDPGPSASATGFRETARRSVRRQPVRRADLVGVT